MKEPNCEDPLNHEAADMLRDQPNVFVANVRRALEGGYIGDEYFEACM